MKQIVLVVLAVVAAGCGGASFKAIGLTEAERAALMRGSLQRAHLALAVLQNEDDHTRKRFFCGNTIRIKFLDGWHNDRRFEWALKRYPELAPHVEKTIAEFGKAMYCPNQLSNPKEALLRGQETKNLIGTLEETYSWEYYQRFRTDPKVFKPGVYPSVYQKY